MKSRNRLSFWLLAVQLIGITTMLGYDKQPNGVVFGIAKHATTNARLVKVQLCTDEIVRIIATPDSSFSTRKSLMVSKEHWPAVPFTVTDRGADVDIITAKLTVRVHTSTGAVAFLDPKGKELLAETGANGRAITPADVMGEATYHIRQLFDSPKDEALYGLGAHQNGLWNYKGHDVDLWQYNIVDVIPFLVSSRNYGILWDNNSRTKFGDIRDDQPISSLRLFGKDGKETGLTAEYFTDDKFESLYASRSEHRIQYEFLDVCDSFPEGYAQHVKAVRWSGEIASTAPGIHKFRFFSSSYAKLWIDGILRIDSYRQNWNPWTQYVELQMKPGVRHAIRIEWLPNGGYIGLHYLPPAKDARPNTFSLYSEVADQLEYYFIAGKNIDEVIHGYREITGKAPMMPKWAMGFWQCRERYKTSDDVLSVVKEFRKRNIPLDNIVQDWFYWKENDWGSHEFDSTRYPDPAGMVKELHNELHAHIMISVWAKFYVGTKHYAEFDNHGWLYKRNVEKQQRDWVGPGYVSTFYDPYNADARKLFWKQMNETLFSMGFDAWWLDSTEPDLQSNLSREETILRIGPTALGSASRYLNTFSLVNCQAVYEGQRKTNPDQRVFILTRSAFAGQQRYASATWSGDVASRWYDLKMQIPAGLNFTIAGIPYWTTDIGGFSPEPRYAHPTAADLEEWRELNTRWFQFGTFCALFRSHGEFPYREMFNIAPEDHPAYQSMVAYDKLRYRLMPYIYSLTGMVTQNDYTIMRALAMDFGKDTHALTIGDQYMFGPSLLINPVTDYKARTRKVYLPAGAGWYDMRSGKLFPGGNTITADAPYTDMPIYVRSGSIIPVGPEIQYTDEKVADPIRIFVYAGSDGAFTLYEDENVNYNYEQGKFALIPLTYSEKNKTLTIGTRTGDFPGMASTRTFEIIRVGKGSAIGLASAAKADVTVTYTGAEQIVRLN